MLINLDPHIDGPSSQNHTHTSKLVIASSYSTREIESRGPGNIVGGNAIWQLSGYRLLLLVGTAI